MQVLRDRRLRKALSVSSYMELMGIYKLESPESNYDKTKYRYDLMLMETIIKAVSLGGSIGYLTPLPQMQQTTSAKIKKVAERDSQTYATRCERKDYKRTILLELE